ncbi:MULTISPECIES: esterase/lipase family protein [unclassified Moraxella]|uniref:esterase/lipase family protein n=1 Tax=unclassified Moraxella TaxID=2685852 RepID=UPI003AF4D2DF
MTDNKTTHNAHDIPNHQRPTVIILHGLYMHKWAMKPLAKRLQKQGFDVQRFGYYSLLHLLPTHSQRLDAWLSARFSKDTPLYLVGHSLGGLVIRDFLHRYPAWQVARCVTLGTPHNGSLSADSVMKLAPSFIGRSYQAGLDGTAPPLKNGVALGSIAGSHSAGLGKVILPKAHLTPNLANIANDLYEPFDGQNDGTVFVSETRLANAKDHIVLPVSHTGMIFDANVAEQVAYFLIHEQFYRPFDNTDVKKTS